MPVAVDLTPSAVDAADYPVAQTPRLGGEILVYLSSSPSRILGTGLLTADGVISWTHLLTPSDGTPGPIVVVATGGGVLQVAADTITYAGLTASFSPVAWSSISTFDFPVGRGVEMTGTYVAPTSSSVPTLTLAAGSGMSRGSQFAIVELPALSAFKLVGCTTDRNVTVPSRATKSIPCGMQAAAWTTPGMESIGELEVTGLNKGPDDGLLRYAGVKCQAMLVSMRESRLITERSICTDWVGTARTPYPSGDGEATVTLSGQYSKFVMLPAP